VTTEQLSEPSTSQTSAGVQDPEAQIPASPEAATQPYAPSQENGQIAQSRPPANAASDDLPDATTATSAAGTESRNREMPRTASNWLTTLLTGGLLTAAGIALRRAVA
jgi:hypothetical protein